MTPGPDDLLDQRLYQQYCFACGHANPLGLKMRFRRDGADGVVCEYTPRLEHQGFPGVMHGGVLVALMDEAMAWAMYAAHRALGVTAKMETRYRRSASPEAPLVVRARVGRTRGRRIEVESSIEDPDGAVLVESTALFLRVPAEDEAQLLGQLGWDVPGPHAESSGEPGAESESDEQATSG